jgi:hypothetical protein
MKLLPYLAALLVPFSALATTIPTLQISELFAKADVVAIVEIVEGRALGTGKESCGAIYTGQIERALKGTVSQTGSLRSEANCSSRDAQRSGCDRDPHARSGRERPSRARPVRGRPQLGAAHQGLDRQRSRRNHTLRLDRRGRCRSLPRDADAEVF